MELYCPLGTHCIRFLQCILIVVDGRHTDDLKHIPQHTMHVYYSICCMWFSTIKIIIFMSILWFLNSLQFPLILCIVILWHLEMIQMITIWRVYCLANACITGNIMFYSNCSLTRQRKELIVKENPAPEEDEGEAKVEEDKPAEWEEEKVKEEPKWRRKYHMYSQKSYY